MVGVFDKLRLWFETPPAPEQKPEEQKPEHQPITDDLQKLLASGNTPAKTSVLREGSFGADFTFMLSGDFIEFNSHSEMDPSYQYEPDYVRPSGQDLDFAGFKPEYPVIAFGPFDDLYEAVDAYLADGMETGRDFHKIDDGMFLFCTKMDYYGQLLYAYAFADESIWEHQMLGLMYDKAIEGTPLEQKLMAILDEAARTYKEE